MTDLTKPFFGNPRETAKADKARAKRAVPYETTWLDEVLRGMFGETEPAGSLAESGALDADPIRAAAGEQKFAKKRTANSLGQAAGVAWDLSDMVNPVTLAAGGLASVMSMSNLPKGLSKTKKGRQAGAIRVGGNPDLYASHAFGRYAAPEIGDSGYLLPPSIGVSAREANSFKPTAPQFVFRAGTLDPSKQMGTMVNRDGYFANPRGLDLDENFDPRILADEVKYYLQGNKQIYGIDDMRLTEMTPEHSQALAIGVSPAFSSFEKYEKSPFGAAALARGANTREDYWRMTRDEFERNFQNRLRSERLSHDDYLRELLQKWHTDPTLLSLEEQKLLQLARMSPSSMAEFKIYDKLDLSPNDAFVHLPTLGDSEKEMERVFGNLRDKGFKFTTSQEFLPKGYADPFLAAKSLPDTVPPTGEIILPPRLVPERGLPDYTEFLNFTQGKAGGGTPPLAAGRLDPAEIDKITKLSFEGTLDKASADLLLEKYIASGAFPEEQITSMTKFVDSNWPAGGADSFSSSISDLFPNVQLAKAKTPVEIGTLSTHSVFESSIPASKKAQWEQILDNNEDYGLVAENAFKKYDIDPAFVPAIIDHLKHQQLMELHKDPNWQTILDKIIGATWGGMKPSK